MKKGSFFTFRTLDGSRRLLGLFILLILIFSIAAQAISTKGYKISVSDVTIEVRGADLHFELYKPANVSSADKLPCMIITHGGSESLAACSMMAWELARRGFVVMNVDAYGAGLSDQPAILEDGTTEDNYNRGATMGMYDAYQYAKTITYVDSERIGAWAHSTGRHLFTKMVAYFGQNLTLNDRLLNVLYENFGVEITEEQLLEDADVIARENLSETEMAVYEVLKQEQQKIVNEYLKSARLTERAYGVTAVVAGHEVIRDPQMNLMVGLGTHEGTGNYYLGESEQYREIFHTGENAVVRNGWYNIPDYTMDPDAAGEYIGQLFEVTSTDPRLKEAIDNGSARYFLSPVTIHNGMLWSPSAISSALEFYTQTMGYNNGDLSDSSTKPIACNDLTLGYATLLCTAMALFSAIGMIVALASMLLKCKYFQACAVEAYTPKLSIRSKNFIFWVIATTITGFAGAWACSQSDLSFTVSNKTMTKWLPWEPGQVRTFFMLIATAVVGLIIFAILSKINKGQDGLAHVSDLKIALGLKPILKTALIGLLLFGAFYVAAAAINTFFDSRFLFVDVSFEIMKGYGFSRTIRYALIMLPFTLIISSLNNMSSLKGVSDGKDTAINVFVTSLGMIVLMGLGFLLTYSTIDHAEVFTIHCVLSIITLVPVTNYLYRKLYKLSGSVWLGAIFVALLLGWRLASYISHQFMYYGPNELSAFWGIY